MDDLLPIRICATVDFMTTGGILFAPLRIKKGQTRVLPAWQAEHLVAKGLAEAIPIPCRYGDDSWDCLIAEGLLHEG